MKRVIRLGDPTTHGGKVVSACANSSVNGIQIARLGDKVACPRPGHGVTTIVEGDPDWLIDGIPVALEGHKTSCGASLISTLPNFGRSYEGMGEASAGGGFASVMASRAGAGNGSDSRDAYDEQTQLVAPPIDGVPYFIETADGRTFSGRVGEPGLLPRIDTADEDEYTVYWGDEALARMAGQES